MTNEQFLETFEKWVGSLVEDAKVLEAVYRSKEASRDARLVAVGGLAYLLRKVDIVPDYLGGLGSVDDAMVLRLCAARLADMDLTGVPEEIQGKLKALAGEATVIREFLGEDYEGFEAYVRDITAHKVRGRTPEQVLDDERLGEQFDYELQDELRAYKPRPVEADEKVLLQLKSVIKAKMSRKE